MLWYALRVNFEPKHCTSQYNKILDIRNSTPWTHIDPYHEFSGVEQSNLKQLKRHGWLQTSFMPALHRVEMMLEWLITMPFNTTEEILPVEVVM